MCHRVGATTLAEEVVPPRSADIAVGCCHMGMYPSCCHMGGDVSFLPTG